MNVVLRRLRNLGARVRRAYLSEVRARGRRRPLREAVFWESFGGNGALDNPEAMFRRMLERPDTARVTHVWALTAGHREFRREFRGRREVRIVRYRSARYWWELSRARYLVNNATFPPEWGKRDGQRYLNTWHGTPLKRMGYDMPDGALQSANVLRNFLSADVLLSQSRWMTETMYLSAYRLRGIFRGRILEESYPRIDRQALSPSAEVELRHRLGADRRRIVLYAPTWNGDDFARPLDEAEQQLDIVTALQSSLGSGYLVLLKTHQAVHELARSHPGLRSVLVDNDLPTNQVLAVADSLVTDFSSIFFDYLALDRPVTFFVPSGNDYTERRGTYIPSDQLPGRVEADVAGLSASITGVDTHETRRREWRDRFGPRRDGSASDAAIDALRGADLPRAEGTDPLRTSVLIYLGGMRSNGITSSALNLLAALDYRRYDVTTLTSRPRSAAQRRNHGLIDPRARQLIRSGGMNGPKLKTLRLRLRERGTHAVRNDTTKALYRDEWRRLVGDAEFDVAVDFSAYSRFWIELILAGGVKRRVVWLHNDMVAEVDRTGSGRRPVHRDLPGILDSLHLFDRLVSVAPALTDHNRESLSQRFGIGWDRFVTAPNLIDGGRVLAASRTAVAELTELEPRPGIEPISAPWVDWLGDDSLVRFVTSGRLSPEKNHLRLLDAFAAVHSQVPAARLVILGDGPLRERIRAAISARGLDHAVALTGALSNPFPVIAAGDCFVMSSDYEGQPMAILEAAVLGIPIITADFRTAREAVPGYDIEVVPSDPGALAEAMAAFAGRHDPAPSRLDYERYNGEAMRRVDSVLGSSDGVSSESGSVSSTSASTLIASHTDATAISIATAEMPIAHHTRTSDLESDRQSVNRAFSDETKNA